MRPRCNQRDRALEVRLARDGRIDAEHEPGEQAVAALRRARERERVRDRGRRLDARVGRGDRRRDPQRAVEQGDAVVVRERRAREELRALANDGGDRRRLVHAAHDLERAERDVVERRRVLLGRDRAEHPRDGERGRRVAERVDDLGRLGAAREARDVG